jgi:N-acetylmuramoyl-L-alanine amidase
MKIVNHRLCRDDGTPYPFRATPNQGVNGNPDAELRARWLVMHYTAGGSAAESIGWLANKAAKASAHIVIAKDGTITQMVPFNRVAWHAGKSKWEAVDGLNSHSIGIELDGFGIVGDGDGPWRSPGGKAVPAADVLVATHKNETAPRGWARYPQAQLDVARELAALLVREYGLKDVIGHEDIAPGRKQDPGPAFPMASFRAAAMAQPAPAVSSTPAAPAAGARLRVTTTLNVRRGPSAREGLVDGSPLPAGTIVRAVADRDGWKQVTAEGAVNGVTGVSGWASAKYLEPAPAALFITTDTVNIRVGPSPSEAKVAGGPLPTGTVVQATEERDGWTRVTAQGTLRGVTGVTGWVNSTFLRPATQPVTGIGAAQPTS